MGCQIHAHHLLEVATSPGDPGAGRPGQGEDGKSATDARLDDEEMAADADDGDAGHYSGKYMAW
jgi:hypothetical protein